MMGIQWTAFDWPSFATIFTGILAVGGAVLVGWKQAAIASRQTEILKAQTEIERIRINSELYDRRLEFFKALDAMMDHVLGDGRISSVRIHKFLEQDRVVAFLFPPNVVEEINEIAELAYEMLYHTHIKDTEIIAGEPVPNKPIRTMSKLKRLMEAKQRELPEIFAAELNLWRPA